MKIDYALSFILLLFSFLTLASCIYANKNYKNNPTKQVAWLIAFSFIVFVYCFSYSLELICITLKAMLFFNTIRILMIAVLQSVTLCMIIAILYPEKKLKLSTLMMIFFVPFFTIIFRLTSNFHTLYYYNFSINTDGAFNTLKYDLGIWHNIYGVHGIVISLFAIGLLIKDMIINKHKRTRSALIIIAVLIPVVIGVLTILEVYICGIVLLPYAFPFTALCFYIAIFRYQLFNIIPLAYKKVFEWTDAGIVVLDNELNIIGYNPSFNNIFPQINNANAKYNIDMLIEKYNQLEKTVYNDAESKIKVSSEYGDRHYTVDSSYLYNQKNIKTGQILSFADVTDIAEAMSQLSELAFEDSLTGAYTRRYFDEHAKLEIERAKRYAHPVSFAMMDLDKFKHVNDKYGHVAGDKVLKNIVKACQDAIRENDIFCRYGGEEFALLMPETDIESAKIITERIRAMVESMDIKFNEKKIHVTISIGYTGLDKVVYENVDSLIKQADSALYNAKINGRNRVEFLPYEQLIGK